MKGESVLVFDSTIVSGWFDPAGVVMQNANHSNHIKANRAWPWYSALCFSVVLVWAGGAGAVSVGQVGRC